jgi:excisionase family DNA binding protein
MTRDSRLLTPKQIMEEYGLGRTKLYSTLESGSLRSIRWGRKYLVRESDLEEFLQDSEHASESKQGVISNVDVSRKGRR